jgi:hypothetical protein
MNTTWLRDRVAIKTLRSASLVLVAALTFALAGSTAMPSTSHAAQNTGGGTSSSDICTTLLNRLKRFHDISKNPNESKAVRDFYAAQAQIALLDGKRNGCSWASQALVSGQGTVVAGNVATATLASTPAGLRSAKGTFKRLGVQLKSGRVARLAGGQSGTPHPPTTTTAVALTSQPTGNPQQDDYCSKVADLINDAYRQGDLALINGDDEGAQAWYDLAAEFIDRSTQNGCRFTMNIRRVLGLKHLLDAGVIARRD